MKNLIKFKEKTEEIPLENSKKNKVKGSSNKIKLPREKEWSGKSNWRNFYEEE